MKFKLFNITWDFTIVVGMLWASLGVMLIGLTFALPGMPWFIAIPYTIIAVVYLATADSIANSLCCTEARIK